MNIREVSLEALRDWGGRNTSSQEAADAEMSMGPDGLFMAGFVRGHEYTLSLVSGGRVDRENVEEHRLELRETIAKHSDNQPEEA
jgi:hypothetical protein